jgi:hypothetical protein
MVMPAIGSENPIIHNGNFQNSANGNNTLAQSGGIPPKKQPPSRHLTLLRSDASKSTRLKPLIAE